MAQIVPRETISEKLGAGVGAGISQGLNELIAHRMQQMQQRQLANAYQSVGLPQELAFLPQDIVKAYLERGGAAAYAPQAQVPAQAIHPEIPQVQQELPEGLQALQALQQQYAQPLTQQQSLQEILRTGTAAAASPYVRQAIAQAKPEIPQAVAPVAKPAAAPAVQEARKPTFAEVLAQPTPREKREQETLELKKEAAKEKIQTKRQQAIDKSNAPFLNQLNKAIPVAEEMFDKANEMLALLESGKVANTVTGGIGTLTRGYTLNPESQRFLALSNDIAALLAANSGVATNFKIKFAQERKPNLLQKSATQKALTQDIIKQANKILERERLSNELIAKNNYQQPPNLKSQVDKIYRESQKKTKSHELPTGALEGDVYEDDNGVQWIVKNGNLMRK